MKGKVALDGLLSDYLRNKRREQAYEYVTKSCNILDIGCGVFLWSDILQDNQKYLGIDIEDFNCDIKKKNISFVKEDLNNSLLDNISDNYDLILSLASIEHFNDPNTILKILVSKLDVNGLIVLTTPAPWAKYVLEIGSSIGLFAKDKHQHQDLLGRKDIELIISDIGIDMINFKRFLFYQNQFIVLQKR